MNWFSYQWMCMKKATSDTLEVFEWKKPSRLVVAVVSFVATATWLYWTDVKIFADEIPHYFALIFALSISMVSVWIYSWILAGNRMFAESELTRKKLTGEFQRIKNREDVIRGAQRIFDRGRAAYAVGFTDKSGFEVWKAGLRNWEKECRDFFQIHTNQSIVHSLDTTYDNTWYTDPCAYDEVDGSRRVGAYYTGMIKVVSDFIVKNPTAWRNDLDEWSLY